MNSSAIINHLKELGFDFRINDLNDTIEVSQHKGEWQQLSDTIEALIRTQWRDLQTEVKKAGVDAMHDAYIAYAHHRRYNPITDYFKSLEDKYQPHENGPYKIRTLASYFKNPDGLFEKWVFKWSVGAVAKIFEGGRNPMLVLASEQQIGKSTFARWLCPLSDNFLEAAIEPDSRDCRLRLADVFVQEVGELGATTKRADLESLKAHITRPFVFERFFFGKRPVRKRAITSFIGTVNPDGVGFLNDPTGSTRFLVCEIESIDFDYTAIKVDDIWAEAYWYYLNVPKCWQLTPAEVKLQAQANEKFEMTLPLDDPVELRLEITHSFDDFMTTKEMQAWLLGHHTISDDQRFSRELAKVLHKRGCKNGKLPYKPGQPHLRGWFGVRKREPNSTLLF